MDSSDRGVNHHRTAFANWPANGLSPLNSFALVAYIPPPLGSFLDALRLELAPGCAPHAHVTILPPRPVAVTPETAWEQIYASMRELPAFEIAATEVEVFSLTSVIYLGVGNGWHQLEALHGALNSGPLAVDEPFPYHPHITIAQDILPGQAGRLRELAARRWAEYQGPRAFDVESITLVQNTAENRWIDLAECSFSLPPVAVVSQKGRSAL
jgi:2'-5' RNA ligase